MSWITDVMLWVEHDYDNELKAAITSPIASDPRGQRLVKLDTEAAGGTKVFCSAIYAAAFNYVSPSEVIAHLETVPWSEYATAVAVISPEEDEPVVVRCGFSGE